MKFIILAGAALSLASAGVSGALAQGASGCPGPAATSAQAYSTLARADSAYDHRRDTSAREVYDARVADAWNIYRWRLVRYEQPRGGNYDALYGPGAYHQNYLLAPHSW